MTESVVWNGRIVEFDEVHSQAMEALDSLHSALWQMPIQDPQQAPTSMLDVYRQQLGVIREHVVQHGIAEKVARDGA